MGYIMKFNDNVSYKKSYSRDPIREIPLYEALTPSTDLCDNYDCDDETEELRRETDMLKGLTGKLLAMLVSNSVISIKEAQTIIDINDEITPIAHTDT